MPNCCFEGATNCHVSSQHLTLFAFLRLQFVLFPPNNLPNFYPHIISPPLHLTLSCPVPFLESPKYVSKRKESAHTLPLPSLHSHPLLRANSDNTMTQSDPLALPNKAATNPNPGQVLNTHGY